MDGSLICLNRRWYVKAMKVADFPADKETQYRADIARLEDEMRVYWSWRIAPAVQGDRFRGAIHMCHDCRDITGSLWSEEDEKEYRKARDKSDAAWAPGLYYERVMKMGGKWGDDDGIEHNPRVARAYRLADEVAEYEEKHGFIEH